MGIDIKQLAKNKNVYCKVSGIITEADWNHWQAKDFEKHLSVALEIRLDRLMFGLIGPFVYWSRSYQHVVKIIDLFIEELSPDKQNKIMGENAINFYKL